MDYLLCADWSKRPEGRALFVADVSKREIRRLTASPLTIDSAIGLARQFAANGRVLLSFDFPLGLPTSFLTAARSTPGWETISSFISFLPLAARTPTFFVPGAHPERWRLQQPFFAVPHGGGNKLAFARAAERMGVQLRRLIDVRAGGNPMFISAGIPGSVGSATIDAWSRLADLLTRPRDFGMWPFEGSLDELFASHSIVIAENYPRAIYATALSDVLPRERARLRIAKTDREARSKALDSLLSRPWVTRNQVTISSVEEGLNDENEFDALMTAAGLLRLVLEKEPLCSSELQDPVSEGGILGTGTINFDLPEKDFYCAPAVPPGSARRQQHVARSKPANVTSRVTYSCPIPGCQRTFVGSRGGWDGHVGSLRIHPKWNPQITHHAERLSAFRAEYPAFFGELSAKRP